MIEVTFKDGEISEYETEEMEEDPQDRRDDEPNDHWGLGGLEFYRSVLENSDEIFVTNTEKDQIEEPTRKYKFAMGYIDSEDPIAEGELTCQLK